MTVMIEPVSDKKSLKQFVDFQWELYGDDFAWVPPLKLELNQRINLEKNSFFKKGKGKLFLAKRGGVVVGRISASISATNMKKSESREGNFGCYEAIDDAHVAKVLFNSALEWLRQNNVTKVVGPIQFRLEDPYPGFLAEGFEHKPYFMMTYSKPYYIDHVVSANFEKAMDLYAYEASAKNPLPDNLLKRAEEAASIPGMKLRCINMKNIYAEAETIGDIFNEALGDNWGHVAFSKRHVRKMAKDLKMLLELSFKTS